MSAAVAPALQTGARTLTREQLLAKAEQTGDEFDVLEVVCWSPSITINALKNKLPHVKRVEEVAKSLTDRKWLLYKHSAYQLTILGWIYLSAAKELLFP